MLQNETLSSIQAELLSSCNIFRTSCDIIYREGGCVVTHSPDANGLGSNLGGTLELNTGYHPFVGQRNV